MKKDTANFVDERFEALSKLSKSISNIYGMLSENYILTKKEAKNLRDLIGKSDKLKIKRPLLRNGTFSGYNIFKAKFHKNKSLMKEIVDDIKKKLPHIKAVGHLECLKNKALGKIWLEGLTEEARARFKKIAEENKRAFENDKNYYYDPSFDFSGRESEDDANNDINKEYEESESGDIE